MYISIVTVLTTFFIVAAGAPKQDEHISHRSRFNPLQKAAATDVRCIQDSDCGDHGQCKNYACKCDEGYITWQTSGVCAYKQESKLAAFLLSFFLGSLGVDWFVLSKGNAGYIIAGIVKLILSCGCCAGICGAIASAARKSEGCSAFFYCLSILLPCGASIWFLVDWIRILADAFKDGNGAPLKPW